MTKVQNYPSYARMVDDEFEVSAYCDEPLVASLDHLSSIKFAVLAMTRPGLNIAARSCFVKDSDITLSNLLSNLHSETPIAAAAPPPESAHSQQINRSLFQRLMYFIFIGIPFAISIGLLVGIIQFVRTIVNDIATVFIILCQLHSMSQKNPQLLPPRSTAIDAIINRGVGFYTFRLIDKKLGMLSCLVKPIIALIVKFLTRRLINFFGQIDSVPKPDNDRKMTSLPHDQKSNDLKHD
ncbi:unnamed protein product [Rotaria magnacalcarata]|uniref:Uncharacterized protein n=2 Tax=Rotaria magnacalcarata TaxID=392030 RepID=A0A816Q3Q3_9BILA|nr:unnamed protein product [Rotaria magnacalcarata]